MMIEVTRETVATEIHGLIREFSTSEALVLTDDMSFESVNISSLDVLQIVFRIEEAHGVEIDTAAFDQVATIGHIITYVHGALMDPSSL